MRSTVAFRFETEFIPAGDDMPEVVGEKGAAWFVELLGYVPRLAIDPELIQEDFGIAVCAKRDGFDFWILIVLKGEVNEWVASVEHAGFLQRFKDAGKTARAELIRELDRTLRASGASNLQWYEERDVNRLRPSGSPEPS